MSHITFSEVVVNYLPLDVDTNRNWINEEIETIWFVKFLPGEGLRSVNLFEFYPNAALQMRAESIDFTREVQILWTSQTDGYSGGLSTALDNLEPGFVLWDGGMEKARDFAKRASSRPFSC